MDSRELSRDERAAIRKLVISECANFDRLDGCLLLGGCCYMLGKWWTGAFCKYFLEAVLALDLALAALLEGGAAPGKQSCAVCGRAFIAGGLEKYCSPACRKEGNRRRSRERMRKKRQKKK